MNKIPYSTYLDKVYGCFLGKTVIGTLGAPYEGIKMPLELPFKPEMVNTMLPNDDLDLQVLWLDVAEKYGEAFTSDQLLDRFVNYCDYSPGEYAVMRKNWTRGIHTPPRVPSPTTSTSAAWAVPSAPRSGPASPP